MAQDTIKVLVVDDDSSLTDLLVDTLSAIGYEPFAANSAKEALKILFKEQIKLVISDINMPEMSGIELLQEIKKINQHLPVMLITGIGSDTIKDQAYASGADGFLPKPFRIGTIESEISKLLRGIRRRRVVIVDDNQEFLTSIGSRLEATDNIVHLFSTFADANRYLDKHSADLVITDFKMPDGDGIDFSSKVRQRHPDLPIIMISAYATDDILAKIKLLGIKRFIPKPVNFTELDTALAAITGK